MEFKKFFTRAGSFDIPAPPPPVTYRNSIVSARNSQRGSARNSFSYTKRNSMPTVKYYQDNNFEHKGYVNFNCDTASPK